MSFLPQPIDGHYTFFTSFYVDVYSLQKYSDSKGKKAQKGDQYVSNIYRHMTKWLIQMKMSMYVYVFAGARTCVYFGCIVNALHAQDFDMKKVISAVHLYEL